MRWFRPPIAAPNDPSGDPYVARRRQMVDEQIARRGVSDARVLAAMRAVPRHEFVAPEEKEWAYADHPLGIGCGQTISQPYVVAVMCEAARLPNSARVLEIGAGCGYEAAVLAELGAEVYSLEIIPELAAQARATLERLHYTSVHILDRDGFDGLPEQAPYDAILIAAAPPQVPESLLTQLKPGGRMVLPVGEGVQRLLVIAREPSGVRTSEVMLVRFVPMTGKAQKVR